MSCVHNGWPLVRLLEVPSLVLVCLHVASAGGGRKQSRVQSAVAGGGSIVGGEKVSPAHPAWLEVEPHGLAGSLIDGRGRAASCRGASCSSGAAWLCRLPSAVTHCESEGRRG